MAVTEPATPADVVGARKLTASAATTGLGQLSVVVDNLHVTYRVYGGRKAVGGAERGSWLRRIVASGAHSGWRDQRDTRGPGRGVSFIAHHGESIGVIGRSGSGKSSLLRAIAGLVPPAQSAVYVSGEPSLLGVNAC
jgi:teichoic acid transport system ATP-binding protein